MESTAFLFKESILPPFPGIVADASAMEEVLEKSGLDWTIARPPAYKL